MIVFNFIISGRFGHVIVIPKNGDNMLRVEVFKELRELDELIRNVTAVYDTETFSFDQICAKWFDQCMSNDILNLHHLLPLV